MVHKVDAEIEERPVVSHHPRHPSYSNSFNHLGINRLDRRPSRIRFASRNGKQGQRAGLFLSHFDLRHSLLDQARIRDDSCPVGLSVDRTRLLI